MSHRERYEAAIARLSATRYDDHLVGDFLTESEKGFSSNLAGRTVGDVCGLTYAELDRMSGVGLGKIRRLITVLERVADLEESGPPSDVVPAEHRVASPGAGLPLSQSAAWELASRHFLRPENATLLLGQVVENLANLHQVWWQKTGREVFSRTADEWSAEEEISSHAVNSIRRTAIALASQLTPRPGEPRRRIAAMTPAVQAARNWAASTLSDPAKATAEFVEGFLTPLFQQLAADGRQREADIIRRRIGVDAAARTLDEVSRDVASLEGEAAVSRERVRQLEAGGRTALLARWPDASHLLDDLWESIQRSGDERICDLCKRSMETLLGYVATGTPTPDDVRSALLRAARDRRTPMSRSDVLRWSGETFPTVTAASILEQVHRFALTADSGDASVPRRYLTDSPGDRLLRAVLHAEKPLTLAEVCETIGADFETRGIAIKGQMERDPRIVQDRERRFLPAERCGVRLCGGVWCVQPDGGSAPIPVAVLSDVIAAGLLHRGIADATVLGVRRFTDQLTRKVFGGGLPKALSEFGLASTLSNVVDRFRTMRRDRLRWDGPGTPPARGKFGWLEKSLIEDRVFGTTFDLEQPLTRHYQDYRSHVYGQLGSNWTPSETPGLRTFESPTLRIPLIFYAPSVAAESAPLPNAVDALRRADAERRTPEGAAAFESAVNDGVPLDVWLRLI